jgi:hypothetical protein
VEAAAGVVRTASTGVVRTASTGEGVGGSVAKQSMPSRFLSSQKTKDYRIS